MPKLLSYTIEKMCLWVVSFSLLRLLDSRGSLVGGSRLSALLPFSVHGSLCACFTCET